MNIREHLQLTGPTKVLFVFGFLTRFAATLYTLREVEVPWMYGLLYPIALSWIMWWWLTDDCKRTHVSWPLDLGLLVYVAWMIVIPYHLFKTRGLKGFLGIASFIGVLIAGSITGLALDIFIWY